MIRTGLPIEDIDEVRKRTLQLAQRNGWSYADIATRSHLTRDQVADFLGCRTGSEPVVIHLIAYLPLDLVYQPQKIIPR